MIWNPFKRRSEAANHSLYRHLDTYSSYNTPSASQITYHTPATAVAVAGPTTTYDYRTGKLINSYSYQGHQVRAQPNGRVSNSWYVDPRLNNTAPYATGNGWVFDYNTGNWVYPGATTYNAHGTTGSYQNHTPPTAYAAAAHSSSSKSARAPNASSRTYRHSASSGATYPSSGASRPAYYYGMRPSDHIRQALYMDQTPRHTRPPLEIASLASSRSISSSMSSGQSSSRSSGSSSHWESGGRYPRMPSIVEHVSSGMHLRPHSQRTLKDSWAPMNHGPSYIGAEWH